MLTPAVLAESVWSKPPGQRRLNHSVARPLRPRHPSRCQNLLVRAFDLHRGDVLVRRCAAGVRGLAEANVVDPFEQDHSSNAGLREDVTVQAGEGADAETAESLRMRLPPNPRQPHWGLGAQSCLQSAGEEVRPAVVGANLRLVPVGDRVTVSGTN